MKTIEDLSDIIDKVNKRFNSEGSNTMSGYNLKTTIHSNQFLIVQISKIGGAFFTYHTIYDTYAKALHEAQNLAFDHTGSKFIVVAVAAVAEARTNPIVTTSYKI